MNRTNEELFNEAIKGDKEAWDILKAEAGSGDREAQYYVSCRYNDPDSSLYDEGLAVYWLMKSAGKGYESAIKSIQCLSKEQKIKYGIEVEKEDIDFEQIMPGGIWSSTGRIDRTTFFLYSVAYAFVGGVVSSLTGLVPLEAATIAYSIEALVIGYLTLMLCAKRLHDFGRSGMWAFLSFIPILPLALLFIKGDSHTNQYGPRPK